jgi:hypothetical protein
MSQSFIQIEYDRPLSFEGLCEWQVNFALFYFFWLDCFYSLKEADTLKNMDRELSEEWPLELVFLILSFFSVHVPILSMVFFVNRVRILFLEVDKNVFWRWRFESSDHIV